MMQLPHPASSPQPLLLLAAAALVLAPVAGAQTATRTALTVGDADKGQTELSAHVSDTLGQPVSAGTVTFETGKESLGAAELDADGNAHITTGGLPSDVQLVAVYHPLADGDEPQNVLPSSSAPTEVHANASGVPTYTLTSAAGTLTTTQGGFASTVLTVTPLNGYIAQVTLSCQSLPAFATCNFSPAISSTANGPFKSTLQVQTQGPGGVTWWHAVGGGSLAWASLLPLPLLCLLRTRRRRRGAAVWLALGCTAVGLVTLSGCNSRYGYEHHPPSEPGGTPLGTSTIVIDASGNTGSAVIAQTLMIPFTVQ